MDIITRFIEKLIYRNKKAVINVQNGDKSRIVAFNLTPSEQMIVATITLGLIMDEHNKRNNASYKDKAEVVEEIINRLCEIVGVDIKIDTSGKHYSIYRKTGL
jgi:predicted RNA-binding protein Jag